MGTHDRSHQSEKHVRMTVNDDSDGGSDDDSDGGSDDYSDW